MLRCECEHILHEGGGIHEENAEQPMVHRVRTAFGMYSVCEACVKNEHMGPYFATKADADK